MEGMTTILLAEDKAAIRESFAEMLRKQQDFNVVVAKNGREAVGQAWLFPPQVALLDIRMPDMTGLEVLEEFKRTVPNCRCIILTTFALASYVLDAYQKDAWAFLTKDTSFQQILDVVRAVLAGRRMFDGQLLNRAKAIGTCPLSERERIILKRTAMLGSTQKVAQELCLSKGTVDNYLSLILNKLNASNRLQAYCTAERNGWL
ncbi:MAG: response regulator transcription factor [Propionibacteriaceae bacterium]|jgi:two-component system response regulator DesR|nr:response regulator transcription factor [Propionibacteriaceae bacterium]